MAASIEDRIERVEKRLDQIMALLQRLAATNGVSSVTSPSVIAHGQVVESAARDAARALAGADPELGPRVGEVLLRLGDPETLDALARIAGLLPQLEYALHGLAAGPELLEEGMAFVKQRLLESGADDHEVKRRVDAALGALRSISSPDALAALAALGGRAPDLAPVALGVADAAHALVAAEGEAELRARLAEAVLAVADPEALGSLARIAALAPDLEYAAQALAAGPALLEEGMAVARERLHSHGLDAHELGRRVDGAAQALVALSRTEATASLRTLAEALPHLSPAASGLGKAARELAAVEGEAALAERLAETVVRLAAPEVLESLVRVGTLLPDIEYAVQALAAGPVLLDEGMDAVRTWAKREGVDVDIDARLAGLGSALVTLSEPGTLASLTRAVALVPKLERLGSLDLEPLVGLAAKLGKKETVASLEALLEVATKKEAVDALTRLVPLLAKQETVDALGRLLPLLAKQETLDALEPLVGFVSRVDIDALVKLLTAASKPATLAAVKKILARTPEVERILEALPAQERTLDLLRSLNAAVADSASKPQSIGLWGLLGAFREDDVQRAAGFGVSVARSLGKTLDARGNGKQLPAKK